jgi:hypothetical protein
MDVVRIPVQVGDGAVVLSSIEHDQVDEVADLEVSPDAELEQGKNLMNGI